MLIPCPNCGPRTEEEFAYGGPARQLPPLDGMTDAKTWHGALHYGGRSGEILPEVWYHHAGCECWVTLQRDPTSHAFEKTPT